MGPMFQTSPRFAARRACVAGVLIWGLAGLAAPISAAFAWDEPPRPFHFREAPFMIAWQADAAAEAFVANHIRPGMPLWAAVKAAMSADARCQLPQASPSAPIVCAYNYMVRPPDGDLGEVWWRLVIVPRPDRSGTVGSASVTREHYGL
jgi:hypothetical protein